MEQHFYSTIPPWSHQNVFLFFSVLLNLMLSDIIIDPCYLRGSQGKGSQFFHVTIIEICIKWHIDFLCFTAYPLFKCRMQGPFKRTNLRKAIDILKMWYYRVTFQDDTNQMLGMLDALTFKDVGELEPTKGQPFFLISTALNWAQETSPLSTQLEGWA